MARILSFPTDSRNSGSLPPANRRTFKPREPLDMPKIRRRKTGYHTLRLDRDAVHKWSLWCVTKGMDPFSFPPRSAELVASLREIMERYPATDAEWQAVADRFHTTIRVKRPE